MWVLLPESKNIQSLAIYTWKQSSQSILQEENKLILNIYIILAFNVYIIYIRIFKEIYTYMQYTYIPLIDTY